MTEIDEAAKSLAKGNAAAEETIAKIIWFPDEKTIRLIEVDDDSIRSDDEYIRPFYFNPVAGIPYVSGIALIHPEEEGKKKLPEDWNVEWEQGVVLFERGGENGMTRITGCGVSLLFLALGLYLLNYAMFLACTTLSGQEDKIRTIDMVALSSGECSVLLSLVLAMCSIWGLWKQKSPSESEVESDTEQ